jgi:membrane protein DedA with SNARE-associated domain
MTGGQLPGVFGHLQPVLEHYGYLAVGGFVLLEDFGVPLPGETVLIAAAIFAGSGHMNIAVVCLVAVIAAIIGDNIGFIMGHFGGRPLVHRYGRYIFLTPERLDQAEDYFNRHGGKIVTMARFIAVLRQLNGILSGIIGMHWAKFLAFNALGAVLWVGGAGPRLGVGDLLVGERRPGPHRRAATRPTAQRRSASPVRRLPRRCLHPDRHPGGRGQLRRRVVPQTAPSKWGGKTVHWADLYCGPITFQIRDQLGLRSALALLTRIHKTAVAVCISAHHV